MSGHRKKTCDPGVLSGSIGQVTVARISVTEVLSFEHAVLQRVLAAVDHLLQTMDVSTDLSPVCDASELIKLFVEKHHMAFEEKNVYPLFKDSDLAELAGVLLAQHREARKINGKVCDLTSTGNVRDRSEADRLRRQFDEYRTLMTAHMVWENTVLFPVMLGTLSPGDLQELKERNERQERDQPGRDATEKMYARLAGLEKSCGVRSVGDFTRSG